MILQWFRGRSCLISFSKSCTFPAFYGLFFDCVILLSDLLVYARCKLVNLINCEYTNEDHLWQDSSVSPEIYFPCYSIYSSKVNTFLPLSWDWPLKSNSMYLYCEKINCLYSHGFHSIHTSEKFFIALSKSWLFL